MAVIRTLENSRRLGEGLNLLGPSVAPLSTGGGQLVGVLEVLGEGEAELLFIGLAGSASGVLPNLLEDREENCGENRNNGDDDE